MKHTILLFLLVASLSSYGQCVIALDQSTCGTNTSSIEILSGTFYDDYQWYYKPISSGGDFQLIPGANNPNFIFDWSTYENTLVKVYVSTENYGYDSNIVEVTDANCFLKTSDFTVQNLKLSPNPAYDRLSISETVNGFTIFNMLGEQIISENNSATNEIDITALPPGVYLLNVQIDERSSVFKFVKN